MRENMRKREEKKYEKERREVKKLNLYQKYKWSYMKETHYVVVWKTHMKLFFNTA